MGAMKWVILKRHNHVLLAPVAMEWPSTKMEALSVIHVEPTRGL